MKNKILLDKNVNVKEIKSILESNGIDAELLNIENLENKNKKLNQTTGLLILGGPTTLPGRLADKETESSLENLKRIIDQNNMGDILHLETAIKEGINYFITNDKDILNKRKKIKEEYPKLNILSEKEVVFLDWKNIKIELNKLLPENKKLEDSNIEQLQNFIAGFNSLLNKNIIDRNIKLGKDFILSAEQNLELSKFSFQNKKYSSAIFNLTLATEKLVKAYGLIVMSIEEKNLKWDIKHDSPLTYSVIMDKEPFKSYLSIMKGFYPNILNKNSGDLKLLVRNKQSKSEILKAKKEEIEKVLDVYQKIENVFNDNTQNQIKNLVENVFSVFPQINGKIKENLKLGYLPKLVISFTNLAAISFITFPHYFSSNYPDSKEVEYNEDLGIVQTFNRLHEILTSCLKNLSEYTNQGRKLWQNTINYPNSAK